MKLVYGVLAVAVLLAGCAAPTAPVDAPSATESKKSYSVQQTKPGNDFPPGLHPPGQTPPDHVPGKFPPGDKK